MNGIWAEIDYAGLPGIDLKKGPRLRKCPVDQPHDRRKNPAVHTPTAFDERHVMHQPGVIGSLPIAALDALRHCIPDAWDPR